MATTVHAYIKDGCRSEGVRTDAPPAQRPRLNGGFAAQEAKLKHGTNDNL